MVKEKKEEKASSFLFEGELHADPNTLLVLNEIPLMVKEDKEEKDKEERDADFVLEGELHADPRTLPDLNKILFDEGELHKDPEMQLFIISVLAIMYPEFFRK